MPGSLTLWLKARKAVFESGLAKPASTQALWNRAAVDFYVTGECDLTDVFIESRTKSVSDTGAGILREVNK